jgi:hypothetical protein
MTNPNDLTFAEYYELIYNFNSKYEHDYEDTQEFLTQLEIGLNSKNEAIKLLCLKTQLSFVDNIE